MKTLSAYLVLLVLMLLIGNLNAQDRLSKKDSLKIEGILQEGPQNFYLQKAKEQQEKRTEYLDSLIADDSTNYYALNQKISQLIVLRDLDNAKAVLSQFHRRTMDTSKYDFIKANLFEYFKEYEKANLLYDTVELQLKAELENSSSDYKKAEANLGLWYLNKYLGNEPKADSLMKILRDNYYQSINVGINWYYFYRRFGEGVFNQ
ncbi:hypothetical protein [Gracilimonas sp.]|uniref:hypothetical protein n=1 Tax=Gracilimonas sp. TaxID=1974203 RepID=UPI002871EC64|nr:hypothetical protein [Gracilimonas sp.]